MDDTIKARFFLFLFGCIGSRLLFTYIAATASQGLLKALGYIALLPVIGWFYIIFIGSRDTGAEVFGAPIWWKSLRPIHMALWALFAALAIGGVKQAWVILLIDTLFGLFSFLRFHWSQGNIQGLLKELANGVGVQY